MPALATGLLAVFPALQGEIRGVWLAPGDLESLSSRTQTIAALQLVAESGANVIFAPAWAGGRAAYPSSALKDALGLAPPERDILAEFVFEAHRLGLEVVPWVEPGIACPSESDCAVLKKRPELFARGQDGKLVLEHGVARVDLAGSPGQDLVASVVLEMCDSYDVDGIVGIEPLARIRRELGVLDPGLVVAASLPAIDAGGADPGDRLVSFARLREKDGELARALREEPWAEDALLPWREGKLWRPRAPPIDPQAGSGTWSWVQPEGQPSFLAIDGGESGHATWTFTPKESGIYRLYAWIPERGDMTSRASYRLASAGGSRTIGIDAAKATNRGWVRLENVRLEARKEIEVARLLAEEPDATKITAAGPLLALLDRRAMRR